MVFYSIPDPQVPTPVHLRPARGRVDSPLSVWDPVRPSHVFVSLLRPMCSVPLRFLGRPQLLTRTEPFPRGEGHVPVPTGRLSHRAAVVRSPQLAAWSAADRGGSVGEAECTLESPAPM